MALLFEASLWSVTLDLYFEPLLWTVTLKQYGKKIGLFARLPWCRGGLNYRGYHGWRHKKDSRACEAERHENDLPWSQTRLQASDLLINIFRLDSKLNYN